MRFLYDLVVMPSHECDFTPCYAGTGGTDVSQTHQGVRVPARQSGVLHQGRELHPQRRLPLLEGVFYDVIDRSAVIYDIPMTFLAQK